MPYGFYITDKGRELITASTSTESKVEITKVCLGSGGSPETEKDYSITELKNQFYEKDFQPGIDSYKISDNDPTELCIETVVPSEVSGTINEIGYKDNSDNLIIYGVVRERHKEAGTEAEGYQLKYENWIKVANADIEKIEINVQSPEVEKLTNQIESVQSSVDSLQSTLESDYTKSSEFTELSDKVNGFESTISDLDNTYVKQTTYNSFTNSVANNYVKQSTYNNFTSSVASTYAKKVDLTSLTQRVQALETALQGVDTLLEELI